MDAVAVKAEILRNLNLMLHEFIAREGVEALRMVTLIQAKLEIKRLVVECDIGIIGAREVCDADLALAEIAVHGIFVSEGGGHLIKERVVQIPEMLVLDGNGETGAFLPSHIRGEIRLATDLERQFERFTFGCRCRKRHVDLHAGIVDIRGEMQAADVVRAARFQIDSLPDAAGVAVALLAIEMRIAGSIVGLDQQGLVLAEANVFQLALERSIAALMAAGLLAVEPGGRLPVGGADHQEDALAFPCLGDGDLTSVPSYVALVLHLGEFGAPGERDQDTLVQGGATLVGQGLVRGCGIEGESPVAIEVEPFGALEIRTRMFRQRNVDGLRGAGAEKEGAAGTEIQDEMLHETYNYVGL